MPEENLKRLKLKCWNCGGKFELTIDVASKNSYVKECVYCGEHCEFDLAPYRKSVTSVFKNGDALDDDDEQIVFDPPKEIRTQKPSKENENDEDDKK